MTVAMMTSKGQLTVPKKIRDALHLRMGDRVDFQLTDKGNVTMVLVSRRVGEVYGVLSRKGRRAVSIEDMDNRLSQSFRKRRV